MRFALCNELLQSSERGWAETCQLTATAGYDGIEIAPFTLDSDVRLVGSHTRKVYARTAQRAGLKVIGLHWLLVSPKGLSLTSREPSIRQATADYLAALTDFCADMGGTIMVLGSPAQRRIPEGDTADIAAERLMAGLAPALARAETHGITLCLEPLPRPEADLILMMDEAIRLIVHRNHPNLRTIFDAKSASSEGTSLTDLIVSNAPYIAHVHANDANRRGPGYGDTDFVPILAALNQIGYTGYISVEPFDYTPDPVTVATDCIAYLRRCVERAAGGFPDVRAAT
jgi:sugar phosphate isomerase/epimerase